MIAPFDFATADTSALDTGGLPAGNSFAYLDVATCARRTVSLTDVENYQRELRCDDASPAASSFPEL